MVEYRDGSMVAQLGPTDMRVPIAHCLAWPDRIDAATRLDFAACKPDFEAPDPDGFPALRLARLASSGAGAPTVSMARRDRGRRLAQHPAPAARDGGLDHRRNAGQTDPALEEFADATSSPH